MNYKLQLQEVIFIHNVGGSGDGVFSVFAKYKDTQYIRLRSTKSYVFFDIKNGVVGR
jgi:hypothetical protein